MMKTLWLPFLFIAPLIGSCAAAVHASDYANDVDNLIKSVYVGNSIDSVTSYEDWLGKPADAVLGYTGAASWSDWDGSVGWAIGLWNPLDKPVLWSVPLIPKSAKLSEAAQGKYNSHYKAAAKKLAKFRPEDNVIYIRTGWEFNGDWFPWSAIGKEKEFVGAWRQFVDSFRSVSNRFRFDWCPTLGHDKIKYEDAYPGDDYVDIIGADIYDETIWCKINKPESRWKFHLTRRYGLNWHRDFAKQHNKPMAYSEWGVGGNGSGDCDYFIEQMHRWFIDNKVIYESYWDSNADYPGKLSEGQYPKAGAKYKELFAIPAQTEK